MRKQGMVALVSVAMMLTMAVQAFAADCQKKITLQATAAGAAIDASGTAEARARGRQQRFKVSMDAAVPDGTTFMVFANGQPAGTITIALGAGELDLNNNNGNTLPAGVNPVCSIDSVDVIDGTGTAVLQGNLSSGVAAGAAVSAARGEPEARRGRGRDDAPGHH